MPAPSAPGLPKGSVRVLLPPDAVRVVNRDRPRPRVRLRGSAETVVRMAPPRGSAAARRPDRLVANSTAVRERIRRFYGRRADVVHPPVELDDEQRARDGARGHFCGWGGWSRTSVPSSSPRHSRNLPHRLVMVGIGPREAALRSRLPDNVELRGWIPREELARLYRESLGFVHVGEEDFGITMVEALAGGAPVIALDAGRPRHRPRRRRRCADRGAERDGDRRCGAAGRRPRLGP